MAPNDMGYVYIILGLLTTTPLRPNDPVPVRIPLAGWDTQSSLRDWLIDQVHEHFQDYLTADEVAMLIDQHRILPVLDGLNEMDTDATPPGLGHAVRAVQQINAYAHPSGSAPLILTCRTAEYEYLATLGVRVQAAARIDINPVTPAQAHAYLTARSSNPERWSPVLSALSRPSGAVLACALSTPWRLNLAAAYEERYPDTLAYLREPADLLAFPSPTAVRDHLLAGFLSAATRQLRPECTLSLDTFSWN
ncbi:hypothetical protein ACWCQ1_49395 [Streptomyces sp. NPDC002144]